MYVRVLQDELKFPDDRAIDQDTKSLIRGVRYILSVCYEILTFYFAIYFYFYGGRCGQLLQRVPSLRICEPRIKKHPYFSMMYVRFPPSWNLLTVISQRLVSCVL